MNHSTLKKFAAQARKDLMEQVGNRLQYVLHSDSVELREKSAQISQLREALQTESEEALTERVAYTWFNRLAALRFMDAQERHPFGARIITPAEGNTQPEILQQLRSGIAPAEILSGKSLDYANDLLDGKIPSHNGQAEAYRLLIIGACNYYHQLMPYVFEKIQDYTELLLPEDLLSEASLAQGFREGITDEDCQEVELIGWLYQYYIADKKDAVMARKKAVPKEDIPAVTQLFTPHWIVRYMVENSLGKLWMQNFPDSPLIEKMDYYIPDPEQQTDFLKITSPEEIKLIDPASGSGHILTYAFDLLFAIYEEQGYQPSTIPHLILTHNLQGVEIDERAASLAYFALMMKGQQHYSRFLKRQLKAEGEEKAVPNICCLQAVTFEEGELKSYMDALDLGDLFTEPVLKLMYQFEEAKNFGSLIQPVIQDFSHLRAAIKEKDLSGQLFLHATHRKVETVLYQAEMLSQRYHCAVANPPYMGSKAMNGVLKSFANTHYKDSKSDLFAMFIERGFNLVLPAGYNAQVTMQSWMFLSSYENLRSKILNSRAINCLLHMDNMVMKIAFGTSATVFQNIYKPNFQGAFCYVELSDIGKDGKPKEFPPKNQRNLQAARQKENK